MKYSALGLGFLFLVVACNSTEKVNLPAGEAQALRERVLQNCVADGESRVTKFQTISADVFGNSGDWVRHKTYEHKYTQTGNTSPSEKNIIRVWKSTSTALYLFISNTIGGTTKRYFLHLPKGPGVGVAAANDDLISDLQLEGCLPLESEDDESYVTISGGSDGPLVAKKQYITVTGSDGANTKTVDTYTFYYNRPAWAGIWTLQKNITFRNASNRPTGTTEEYKSTFAPLTGQTDLSTVYTGTDFQSNDNKIHFCEADIPAADTTYPSYPIVYKLPYMLDLADTNLCTDTWPGAGTVWEDFPI